MQSSIPNAREKEKWDCFFYQALFNGTKSRKPTGNRAIRAWSCEMHYYFVEIDWHFFSASKRKLHNPAEVSDPADARTNRGKTINAMRANILAYFECFCYVLWLILYVKPLHFVFPFGIADNAIYLDSLSCCVFLRDPAHRLRHF